MSVPGLKGVVSAGHPETVRAATEILLDGGNAFDAVVAAHLAACVCEPVLSSLGGGGFLTARLSDGAVRIYDFFVQTPLTKRPPEESDFYPITADFGTTTQVFHIGCGSVATPGTVSGLFTLHRDLCTLPFRRLAEPAIALARKGCQMNSFQAEVLRIVSPIYTRYPEVATLFEYDRLPDNTALRTPQLLPLADVLEALAHEGESLFYEGEIAQKAVTQSRERGGHLTLADFRKYRTIRREPLQASLNGTTLYMNPPPGEGGVRIAHTLKLMQKLLQSDAESERTSSHSESELALALARAQINTDELRKNGSLVTPQEPTAKRGTTHISIIDSKGNAASLSTSNGEGCGLCVPGTGILLNNMLGEEDLSPAGLQAWPVNTRMSSMMSPTVATTSNGTLLALGSGGSSRIRSAITCVLANLLMRNMPLRTSIEAPRLHADTDSVHMESGWSDEAVDTVRRVYPNLKQWQTRSLFFGGVHGVRVGPDGKSDGWGDPRRGGDWKRVGGM